MYYAAVKELNAKTSQYFDVQLHQKLVKEKEFHGGADCPNQDSLSKWLGKICKLASGFSWLWTYAESQLATRLEVILLGGVSF